MKVKVLPLPIRLPLRTIPLLPQVHRKYHLRPTQEVQFSTQDARFVTFNIVSEPSPPAVTDPRKAVRVRVTHTGVDFIDGGTEVREQELDTNSVNTDFRVDIADC